MTTRNKKYERSQNALGLKKVTFWIPENRESDIRQAISKMVENEDLTISVLQNTLTGRAVSMHKN